MPGLPPPKLGHASIKEEEIRTGSTSASPRQRGESLPSSEGHSHTGTSYGSPSPSPNHTPNRSPLTSPRDFVSSWQVQDLRRYVPTIYATASDPVAHRESDDMPAELLVSVGESVTFDGAEHLSRAIRLSKVMRGFGKIFQGAAGNLETYELSERTNQLKYFISHNWSVSRFDKFLALSLKFNFKVAAVTTFFCSVIFAVATAVGMFPQISDTTQDPPVAGVMGRIFILPICCLMLFSGNDIRACVGWEGPLTFLDKACIHQVDVRLKLLGIHKLGAFLRISDRMLTLYTDIYFRKLWTVHEVANFLTMNTIDNLDVIPVFMPRVIFAAIPANYAYGLLNMAVRTTFGLSGSTYVFLIVGSWVYMIVFRRWARHKVKTQEQLKIFEVRNCTCAVESDRKVVYEKIADLMRFSKRVERTATLDEALTVFDMEVRRKLPAAFKMIFGSRTLSYQHYVFLGFTVVAPPAVDAMVRLQYEEFWVQAGRNFLHDLMWIFTFWPLVFCFTEVAAGQFLRLRGIWQVFVFVGINIAVAIPAVSIHLQFTSIANKADDDTMATNIMLGACLLVIGSTFLTVYVSRRCWRRQKLKAPLAAKRSTAASASSRSTASVPSSIGHGRSTMSPSMSPIASDKCSEPAPSSELGDLVSNHSAPILNMKIMDNIINKNSKIRSNSSSKLGAVASIAGAGAGAAESIVNIDEVLGKEFNYNGVQQLHNVARGYHECWKGDIVSLGEISVTHVSL